MTRDSRRKRPLAQGLCAVGLLSLATAAAAQDALAPEAPDQPWRPHVTDGEIVAQRRAPTADLRGYVLPSNPALAVLPPAPQIDAARTYDLADLIDLAASHNPRTRVAWDAARDAASAAGLARSAYLPRLTATVLGGYQGAHGHGSALGAAASPDTSASGTISALSLQWLLFDFGGRRAVVDGADQVAIAGSIGFTAAHQRLIRDVSLAFYAHAAARARAASAERALVDANAVEAAATHRYAGGVGTVIEVAQAKQAAAQARLAQVQAAGALDDAYVQLLAAMGLPPLTRITIADVSGRRVSAALDGDVQQAIAAALGRRPDVLTAYASLKASQAGERAARAAFLPKVFMSTNLAYSTGDLSVTGLPAVGSDQAGILNLSNRRFGASILAGVTVPLYDGGMRSAALAQARDRADQARATLDQVRNDAVAEIVVANNALRTSLAARDAAGELRAAAQTTFDAALAAYRNGVGTSTEVVIAERQLLEARNADSDAYSAALSAAATLAFVTGSLGESPDP